MKVVRATPFLFLAVAAVTAVAACSASDDGGGSTAYCGDGICNGGETTAACQQDCPASPACGDNACNGSETCSTCSADCGACPATCGNQSCGAGESCSTCPVDCGTCPAQLSFSWEYPILVNSGGALYFPSYVAHLLGGAVEAHPWEFETACVTVTNSGTTPRNIVVEATLVGYSTTAGTSGTAAASSTTRLCANPVPNLTTLYGLSSNAPASVSAVVKDASTQMTLTSASTAVTVLPGSDILWSASGLPTDALRDLSAVFSLPHHPSVESLLTSVASRSAFGNFGADAYVRGPRTTTHTIAVGAGVVESAFFGAAESVQWLLPVVTGGSGADIDFYVFTSAQYQAWLAGTSTQATAVWTNQVQGASGTFTAAAANWYVLVLFNTTDNFVSRNLNWTRTSTREFVVRDVMQSIFDEMKARGMLYVSIPSTFFAGAQHIKRVDQILSTGSANCIDGTLLFVSVMELIGMQPVVVFRTGHAYVAVRDAPGSSIAWPVETTMVNTDTFWNAYTAGITEFNADAANDPWFYVVDVDRQRQFSVLPMPQ